GRGRCRAAGRSPAVGRPAAAHAGSRWNAGAGDRGGVVGCTDRGVSRGQLRSHLTTVAGTRHAGPFPILATVVVVALYGSLPMSARDARADMATSIVVSRRATPLEVLAAREVRRYVYLTTGVLLRIRQRSSPGRRPAIVVAQHDRSVVRRSGAHLE